MTKRKQQRPRCHVPECNSEIGDGVYVCDPCIADLDYTLANFPSIWAELETTLTKQAKMIASSERRGAETPVMFHISAADISRRINKRLAYWCKIIMAEHACPSVQPESVNTALVEWLRDQLDWLQRQTFASTAVMEIRDEIAVVYQVIDRPPELRFLGLCDCGAGIYSRDFGAFVDCRKCAMLHNVETLNEAMLLQANDRLFHASMVSRVLARCGEVASPMNISRWVAAGRLLVKGHDSDGRSLYRVGDVRRLAAELAEKKRTG